MDALAWARTRDGRCLKLILAEGVPVLLAMQYVMIVDRKNQSPSTQRNRAHHLLACFQWLATPHSRFEDVTDAHPPLVLRHLRASGNLPSTLQQTMADVLRFLAWCMAPAKGSTLMLRGQRPGPRRMQTRGLLAGVTTEKLRAVWADLPTVKRTFPTVISEAQVDAIRRWLDETFSAPTEQARRYLYRAVIERLWDGAWRRGARRNLQRTDFTRGTETTPALLHVQVDAATEEEAWLCTTIGPRLKAGERILPLAASTAQWLYTSIVHFRPPEAALYGTGRCFTNVHADRQGHPRTIAAVDHLFGLLNAYALGDGHLTPQLCRHTWATNALKGGVKLHSIPDDLGHASESSTALSLHLEHPEVRAELHAYKARHRHRSPAPA